MLDSRTAAKLENKLWTETDRQYFQWLGAESLARAAFQEVLRYETLQPTLG